MLPNRSGSGSFDRNGEGGGVDGRSRQGIIYPASRGPSGGSRMLPPQASPPIQNYNYGMGAPGNFAAPSNHRSYPPSSQHHMHQPSTGLGAPIRHYGGRQVVPPDPYVESPEDITPARSAAPNLQHSSRDLNMTSVHGAAQGSAQPVEGVVVRYNSGSYDSDDRGPYGRGGCPAPDYEAPPRSTSPLHRPTGQGQPLQSDKKSDVVDGYVSRSRSHSSSASTASSSPRSSPNRTVHVASGASLQRDGNMKHPAMRSLVRSGSLGYANDQPHPHQHQHQHHIGGPVSGLTSRPPPHMSAVHDNRRLPPHQYPTYDNRNYDQHQQNRRWGVEDGAPPHISSSVSRSFGSFDGENRPRQVHTAHHGGGYRNLPPYPSGRAPHEDEYGHAPYRYDDRAPQAHPPPPSAHPRHQFERTDDRFRPEQQHRNYRGDEYDQNRRPLHLAVPLNHRPSESAIMEQQKQHLRRTSQDQNDRSSHSSIPPGTSSSPDAGAGVVTNSSNDNGPPHSSRTVPSQPRDEIANVGCTCKKSKCLKLYCQCFAARIMCGHNCRCLVCLNTPQHEQVRKDAIKAILVRNPSAFETKFKQTEGSGLGGLGSKMKVAHKLGCKCRKSGCLKKYCECYHADVKCSSNCRCVGCQNMPPGIPPGGGSTPGESSTGTRSFSATAVIAKNSYETPMDAKGNNGEPWMMNAAQNLTFLKHGSPQRPEGEHNRRGNPEEPREIVSVPSLVASDQFVSPEDKLNEDCNLPAANARLRESSSTSVHFSSAIDNKQPQASTMASPETEKSAGKVVNTLLMAAYAMTQLHTGGTPPSTPTKNERKNAMEESLQRPVPQGTPNKQITDRNKQYRSPKRKSSCGSEVDTLPEARKNFFPQPQSKNERWTHERRPSRDSRSDEDETASEENQPNNWDHGRIADDSMTPSVQRKVKRSRLGSAKKTKGGSDQVQPASFMKRGTSSIVIRTTDKDEINAPPRTESKPVDSDEENVGDERSASSASSCPNTEKPIRITETGRTGAREFDGTPIIESKRVDTHEGQDTGDEPSISSASSCRGTKKPMQTSQTWVTDAHEINGTPRPNSRPIDRDHEEFARYKRNASSASSCPSPERLKQTFGIGTTTDAHEIDGTLRPENRPVDSDEEDAGDEDSTSSASSSCPSPEKPMQSIGKGNGFQDGFVKTPMETHGVGVLTPVSARCIDFHHMDMNADVGRQVSMDLQSEETGGPEDDEMSTRDGKAADVMDVCPKEGGPVKV